MLSYSTCDLWRHTEGKKDYSGLQLRLKLSAFLSSKFRGLLTLSPMFRISNREHYKTS